MFHTKIILIIFVTLKENSQLNFHLSHLKDEEEAVKKRLRIKEETCSLSKIEMLEIWEVHIQHDKMKYLRLICCVCTSQLFHKLQKHLFS